MGWVHSGPIGLGNWIVGDDGRQIAVTYGSRVNPKSVEDTALIVAAPDMAALIEELERALVSVRGDLARREDLLEIQVAAFRTIDTALASAKRLKGGA